MKLSTNHPESPIRVAHLTSVHTPFDNRIFFKEAKTLANAGYDVVLIATHSQDETVEGIPVRSIPKPKNRFQRMFGTALKVTRRAWHENAAIYHIHDPELLIWSQVHRLRGKTVIFDMHENMPKSILSKTWIKPPLRRAVAFTYRCLERIMLWRMPIVFAETSYANDYKWVDKRHCTILNMPVVDDLITIQEDKIPSSAIGYIGDVRPIRGSMVILESLNCLKQMGREVSFECVGRIPDSHHEVMEAYIDQHQLEHVKLYGYLLPKEGFRVMARCHIGLAIFMPSPNFINSYPTKMFEYMALALPIVASGFPLYRSVIEGEQCGLCLDDPSDPQGLADAICWLLDHPQEAVEMGRRGRQAVTARYTWAVEGEKLVKFYNQFKKIHVD